MFRFYNSFKHFSNFFLNSQKKKKNAVFLKILKISEKSNGRFTLKIVQVSLKPFSSKKYIIELYTQLFKDLKPMLARMITGISKYPVSRQ